jgi:hypothetical protein
MGKTDKEKTGTSSQQPPAPKTDDAVKTCTAWAKELGKDDRKYRGIGKAIALVAGKDKLTKDAFLKAVEKFRKGVA